MFQTWWFLRFFRAFNRQNRPTCYTPCALWVFTRRCTWALQKLPEHLRIRIIRSVLMRSITMSVSRWWQLKYFLMCTPKNWGRFPIWLVHIFSDGGVQPPTSFPVSWALVNAGLRIPRPPQIWRSLAGLGALMACPDPEPDLHQAGQLDTGTHRWWRVHPQQLAVGYVGCRTTKCIWGLYIYIPYSIRNSLVT